MGRADARGAVCLHSGVFLRAQYLAFLGGVHREAATRFVARYRAWCGARAGRRAPVERTWRGSTRLCTVAPRSLYRALGAEHLRHRREASPAVVLRRLLSLDYVVERPGEPWLATETEKVAALQAAGAPERALPRRVYRGRRDSRTRYFAHKLSVALDAERATFVFVQAEDVTPSGVRTWGEAHAGLWAALRAAGRAVEVVVVGRDLERLAAAEPVLAGWMKAAEAAGPAAGGGTEAARAAKVEFAEIQAAVARGDLAALEAYGGINGALARIRDLSAAEAGTGRAGDHERPDVALDEGAGMIRLLAGASAAAAVWAWWPFPAPGADPVADLIAMHSPRLHAAIRAWHYLAPALAVVGAWSVAASVGLVWLAGGRRRPVAGVLPPWPVSRSDAAPAVVVGEVHHPVEDREAASPEWLVLPETGLYTGMLICGAIGSGKTSACMRPFARQLLSWQAADSRRRIAGLGLEVKGDFCEQVRGILDARRAEDYVELGIGGRWRWNPLGDNLLDSYSLAYTIASLHQPALRPLEGAVLAAGVRQSRALDHRAAPDGASREGAVCDAGR